MSEGWWLLVLVAAMVTAAAILPVALYRLAENRLLRSRMALAGVRSHRRPVDRAPDWPNASDVMRCPECGQMASPWMFWVDEDEE